jgi:hypothetical protein
LIFRISDLQENGAVLLTQGIEEHTRWSGTRRTCNAATSTSRRFRRPPQAEELSERVERETEPTRVGLGLGDGGEWRERETEPARVGVGLGDGGVGLGGRRDRCPARRRGRGRQRLGSATAWRALTARRRGQGRRRSISLAACQAPRELGFLLEPPSLLYCIHITSGFLEKPLVIYNITSGFSFRPPVICKLHRRSE